ncbi:MAG: hypothetical protein D6734_11325 [Candidatus Schekmanbacteria bacterium]|nr:MAG: hypothetical protein D6734_11325 [Candidatus Schekmanbacteria bacterium]
MNIDYYEIKLKELKTKPFSIIFLMFFLSFNTLFEITLANAEINTFWGIKIFFLTFALIISSAFITQLERRWEKKYLGMFISFIPCSLITIIFLSLEKMLVVSTTDMMWPMGTLGAAFFVKPQDLYLPIILIFLFWALLDFRFHLSPRRALTPRLIFWTFCIWWFSKDLLRLGTFLFDLHSFGSWSFTIILCLFSIGSLIGMLVSKEKENSLFWSITTANLALNAIILVYSNAYT